MGKAAYVMAFAEAAKHERNEGNMNKIDDKTVEYVSILAKLKLSEKEQKAAGEEMNRMLAYIDQLNELDTEGIVPMSHIFPVDNVFREDVITNGDERDWMLNNAPEKKDGAFKVPKTIES